MSSLEDKIDELAEKLPVGFNVLIHIEKGGHDVRIECPQGEQVILNENDMCWEMLIDEALRGALELNKQWRQK